MHPKSCRDDSLARLQRETVGVQRIRELVPLHLFYGHPVHILVRPLGPAALRYIEATTGPRANLYLVYFVWFSFFQSG